MTITRIPAIINRLLKASMMGFRDIVVHVDYLH